MPEQKYKLDMGCHNGGIASRDSSTSEHNTFEEAKKQYNENKKFYNSIRYYVWFAKIYDPDNRQVFQDNGVPYRRAR